jgi:uncharacterized membrane protein
MLTLIAGLLLFLGMHAVRVVAEPLRTAAIARIGMQGWRGLYSAVSLVGLWLLVSGYASARLGSPELYAPPAWAHTVALALMLPCLVLVVAAYVPGTHIRQWVGHPMLFGTRVWAFAHLLANGRLADVALFGSFLAWSIFAYHAARARDRVAGTRYPAVGWPRDSIAVVVGAVGWLAILCYLHVWIAGVPLTSPGPI